MNPTPTKTMSAVALASDLRDVQGNASGFAEAREDIANFIVRQLGGGKIGEGADREVYAVGNEFVVKIGSGMYDDGVREQNRTEARLAGCLGSQYFPKMYDYDREDFLWLLAERVEMLPDGEYDAPFVGEFLRASGLTMDDMRKVPTIAKAEREAIRYGTAAGFYWLSQFFGMLIASPPQSIARKSRWLRELRRTLTRCKVRSVGDVETEHNWGLGNDGRLVILDSGMFVIDADGDDE